MRLQLEIWVKKFKAFAYFIFNAAQFISAMLAILTTAIGLAIIVWLLKFQALLIPILTFSAGVFITLVVVIYAYTRSSPSRRLLRGYRWVQAEYMYTIHEDDPKHHSQTISILLEAMRPGVDHFENRYSWSGKGKEEEPTILSPGHGLLGPPLLRGGWKYYFIHLGHELAVGERIEVKLVQELYDSEGKFEPFLAKVVYEPVDRLILHVVLPRKSIPVEASCSEESGPTPTNHLIKKTPTKISQSGVILWDIPSPVFGHRYVIHWR